ncbi:hypothetical protein L1987_22533 [Smallanthus sonchifolius]|uniref:Uncharacterized protein n=1 Tax=Smallanthus sonchifolius TaxID=185202 RepID=A0ACB9IHS1_9ASTR|nr:hypothetical protein L1987_22533 [Smallanthus sonchifolius]
MKTLIRKMKMKIKIFSGGRPPCWQMQDVQVRDLFVSSIVCNGFFSTCLWHYGCNKCRYYAHVDCATSKREAFMSILMCAGLGKTYKNFKDDDHANLIRCPFPDESVNLLMHNFINKGELIIKGKIDGERFSHEHPLILFDTLLNGSVSLHDPMKKVELLCDGCVRPIMDLPFYKCSQHDCGFVLHEWCTRLPSEIQHHHDHPEHTLVLMPKCEQSTYSGYNSSTFVFSNVKFRRTHEIMGHPHPLTFVQGISDDGQCNVCNERLQYHTVFKCFRFHKCRIGKQTPAVSFFKIQQLNTQLGYLRNMAAGAGPMFFPESPLAGDLLALTLSTCYAFSLLRFFEETAKRGVFEQKLNRKLLHITFGLGFMLFWPLFSSGIQGAVIAAIIPGVNVVKVLLIGLGIVKDEATVKSMTRFGDYRELIRGPMYYAIAITLCCAIYWRTSPIAIAGICNLCAGDGIADIIGRRFGKKKIPYNKDKSFAGSIAMGTTGFVVSAGYMYYFSMFGFVEKSFKIMVGFLVVSLASAFVESHPICTKFDDNLMVPLASVLLGSLVFS